MQSEPILTGNWDDNVSWKFYLANKVPDISLCHAVFCLAILPDTDQIVLTHIERGWEMLGGHIEPGETLEEAVIRECLEEGGFQPDNPRMFGYSKITAKQPVANDHHGGFYPQTSYMPYFLATTKLPLLEPTGEEVLERGVFSLDEITALNINHEALIRIGMDIFHESRKE